MILRLSRLSEVPFDPANQLCPVFRAELIYGIHEFTTGAGLPEISGYSFTNAGNNAMNVRAKA